MKILKLENPDLILIQQNCFIDKRGFFIEQWHREKFNLQGIPRDFVQDNLTQSLKGTIRGLHYQIICPQAKLISVAYGEIFDVAVDLRKSSPFFGKWTGLNISASSGSQIYIPEGFAHGFLVLSDFAVVTYKVSDYYNPEGERCIAWNDPTIAIDWPLDAKPVLSDKDLSGLSFVEAEYFD